MNSCSSPEIMFRRHEYDVLRKRLDEPRRFIQILLGPRQVGKTTVVWLVLQDLDRLHLYFSADDAVVVGSAWLENCWAAARLEAEKHPGKECVLVIDEVQRIPNWTAKVKRHWDNDSWNERNVKVVLVASPRALTMDGLTESLFECFEEIRMTALDVR